MKTCIIIEDQPPAQRILTKYITDLGSLELKGVFSSALDALDFLAQHSIDLLFLDIHLPNMSGMEFLKTQNSSTKVILTSAFSRYALESYEFNVVDYLLKPFSYERFQQAITKSETIFIEPEKNKEKEEKTIFIKSGYDRIKLHEAEILFIKSDNDYTEIYTNGQKHLNSDTLKEWKSKLSAPFCQIHKSYILNTSHIERIKGNTVYLHTGEHLPIGRTYKAEFITFIG